MFSFFVSMKVCMVCSQGDYKNPSVFLAVWLQHHKLVPLHRGYKAAPSCQDYF